MKKYIYSAIALIILCAIINIAADTAKNTIPKVSVTVSKKSDCNKTISCSGIIKEKDAVEVIINYPVYFSDVNVKEGDTVAAGDTIATIDKEKTVKYLKKLDNKNLIETLSNFGINDRIAGLLNSDSQMLSEYSEIISEISAGNAEITAPCNGTVVSSDITDKVLMTSSSAIVISDRREMSMEAYIPESRINEIKIGQEATVACNALKNERFYGKVSSISPNSGNNGVKITVDIENADGKLKYGFEASGDIVISTYTDAVTVPYKCIVCDGENNYIYAVKENRTYKKEIGVLTESVDGCAIYGIDCDEYVVLDADNLDDGESVKITSVTE